MIDWCFEKCSIEINLYTILYVLLDLDRDIMRINKRKYYFFYTHLGHGQDYMKKINMHNQHNWTRSRTRTNQDGSSTFRLQASSYFLQFNLQRKQLISITNT